MCMCTFSYYPQRGSICYLIPPVHLVHSSNFMSPVKLSHVCPAPSTSIALGPDMTVYATEADWDHMAHCCSILLGAG